MNFLWMGGKQVLLNSDLASLGTFSIEVNNRETIPAIEVNDKYCLQNQIEKFPLSVEIKRSISVFLGLKLISKLYELSTAEG